VAKKIEEIEELIEFLHRLETGAVSGYMGASPTRIREPDRPQREAKSREGMIQNHIQVI
jgi:hypothetical protein